MKVCSKCGVPKEHSAFYSHKTGRDGLMAQCKVCRNAVIAKYVVTNIDKFNVYHASYYVSNHDEIRARAKIHYRTNHESAVLRAAKYHAANAPAINARKRNARHVVSLKEKLNGTR